MTSVLALASSSITYVKTSNGTNVEVFQRSELSQSQIENCNSYCDAKFPSADRIVSASARYNCHSFAWYFQNVNTNQYWMNNPDDYYNDNSYFEVSYDDVQPRDKICYFNSEGYNLHSGIVLYLTGELANNVCGYSNTVGVQSKWGSCGLYNHKGDYCPYIYLHGGEASYVKFYRINQSHTHSFYYSHFNDEYHYENCSCGSLLVKHNFTLNMVHPLSEYSPNYIPEYVCVDCGFSTLKPVSVI